MSVYRDKFVYKSHDKRDDFPFKVSNYPILYGNLPSGTSYGVFVSQLVRYCDTNSNILYFCTNVSAMIDKFTDPYKLRGNFLAYGNKYLYKWIKFNTILTSDNVLMRILSKCLNDSNVVSH